MLNVITLFSGYDSQCLALNRLGVEYDLVAWSEIDKYAIQAHNALFPQWENRNLGDITKIDWSVVKQPIDLMTYSSPCITEDMLILTERGYVMMKDVSVGDVVLTKSNTMHRVLKKFDNGTHPTYYLEAMGCEGIQCTSNHKFYVRALERKWNNKERKYNRVFGEPDFVEAKDLRKSVHYLGIPVNDRSEVFYTNETSFWYFVGMYVGDGWLSVRGNEILICGNEKKLTKLTSIIPQEWNWTINTKTKSCARLRFNNRDIYQFLYDYIGTGYNDKHIPKKILDMPIEQLTAFYEGYRDSDGCEINGNIVQFTSVNRNLIYSISAIINKIYKRPVCIYKNKVPPKTIIEGREVNQQDWYQLRFRKAPHKQQQAFYENGYIWYPFRKLEPAGEAHVYNMEIEDDHSYILQGCVSKNCQDFSSAGLQKGGERGSGTRSGLLWECERAILALKPKYLVFENVSALVSEKFKPTFLAWGKLLEEYGYTNYWQLMNAKNYGVPQNRLRIFMVSIRNGEEPKYYRFPKPFPLEKRLKDVLEKNVPESYYLKDEVVERMLLDNIKQKEKGNGFRFEPKTSDDEYSFAITTSNGTRRGDNYIEEVVQVGNLIDNEDGFDNPQRGRVYSDEGVSPCLNTESGGGLRPKIIEEKEINEKTEKVIETRIAAMRGRDKDNPSIRGKSNENYEQRLEIGSSETSNTLTSVSKDNLVVEQTILDDTYRNRDVRLYDEYAPTLRSEREGLKVQEVLGWSRDKEGNIIDRHAVDVANCVTSGKRDNTQNYVKETMIQKVGDRDNPTLSEKDIAFTINANPMSDRNQFVKEQIILNGDSDGNATTITTAHHYSGNIINPKRGQKEMGVMEMCNKQIRVRKLTERELFRLMDVEESDIDILLNAGISKSQLAKLAGNSIVVNCLYHIFDRLLVHTEKQDKEQLTIFDII